MTIYLLINVLIVIVPFIFSFEKKIYFIKNITDVVISVIAVGTVFLVWDSFAVSRGDWSFNPLYVTFLPFINLPLEEILFFISVPYSILFVYECVVYYVRDKQVISNHNFLIPLFIITAVTGLIFSGKDYTFTVMLYLSILFLMIFLFRLKFILYRSFFLTVLVSFIPFFIVNYLLTYLPVVMYNSAAITGLKLFTIPAEDLFYSVSMIISWIAVYRLSRDRKLILNKTV